jgi:hypothetical protein
MPNKSTAKAIVAAIVTAAAYLVGVFPADASLFDGLADLTGLQWLGLVVFMGGAYGITYAVPNKPTT